MADSNAKELLRQSDKLFAKKYQLDLLWQRLAEEFYPERADFTVTRLEGEEFAEHLFESTPAQNRRELAHAMGSLMRPPAKKWFKQIPKDADLKERDDVVEWCGYASEQMRGLIYAGKSGWQRALPEGDNDVISFGNAVHAVTEGPLRDGLLIYETFHLRDCAWTEDRYRVVNRLDRKFKLALRNWEQRFPGKPLSEKYTNIRKKDPDHEIEIRHIALPIEEYDGYEKKKRDKRTRFASVYIDVENIEVVREGFYFEFPYFVRRWNLKRGSPYGYSPAAMLGLVDARVLQAQARVILDAGELAVRPPIVARDEVLGDASLYAGAINWVNAEYDERLGEVIRPVELGQNLNVGLEMKIDTRQILAAAFYLNKLTLPSDKEMTAYEVGERLNEYIRSIGPVVEPFEADNTGLLDRTFDMGLRLGRFGPLESIPPILRGQDLAYEFDTPIQLAYARQKQMRAKETVEYAGFLVQSTGDQSVLDNLDKDKLLRDGVRAIDGEAEWLIRAEEVAATRQQRADAMMAQERMQQLQQGIATAGAAADVVPKIANAGATIGALMGPQGGQPADDEMWPEGTDGDGGEAQGAQPQQIPTRTGGMNLAEIMGQTQDVSPEEAMGGPQPIQLQAQEPMPMQGGTGGGDTPSVNELKGMIKDLIATMRAKQKVIRDKSGRIVGVERE